MNAAGRTKRTDKGAAAIRWNKDLLKSLADKIFPGDAIAQKGIIWSGLGFGIIGASGLILNLMIGFFYGPGLLGIFNQVMAFYVVLGQMGALGMQTAAVHYISREACGREQAGRILSSFFLVVSAVSGLIAFLCWALAEPVGLWFYHSPPIVGGLRAIAPAIFFFAINKLFLGAVNGIRCMRAFAVFQSLRYLSIILFVFGAICFQMPEQAVMYAFLLSELVVFFSEAVFLLHHTGIQKPKLSIAMQGMRFGAKGVIGGIVGELNTKADILVLGLFCADEIVGVYSFASILAEGFFTLIVVFRNNINPIFAKLIYTKDWKAFEELCRQTVKRTMRLSFLGAGCLLALYLGLCGLLPDSGYLQAFLPLLIILGSMSVSSGAIVKGNVLTHFGHPERDTLITTATLIINFSCNFLLIPWAGMIGAAMATGISYICFMMIVNAVIRKTVK